MAPEVGTRRKALKKSFMTNRQRIRRIRRKITTTGSDTGSGTGSGTGRERAFQNIQNFKKIWFFFVSISKIKFRNQEKPKRIKPRSEDEKKKPKKRKWKKRNENKKKKKRKKGGKEKKVNGSAGCRRVASAAIRPRLIG